MYDRYPFSALFALPRDDSRTNTGIHPMYTYGTYPVCANVYQGRLFCTWFSGCHSRSPVQTIGVELGLGRELRPRQRLGDNRSKRPGSKTRHRIRVVAAYNRFLLFITRLRTRSLEVLGEKFVALRSRATMAALYSESNYSMLELEDTFIRISR